MDDRREPGARPHRPLSTAVVVVITGLVVFALVIGRWLTTPFDDWVPLEAPDQLPAGVVESDLPDSARFECSQPLGRGSEVFASDQAQEALATQGLSRAPCEGPRTQYRLVGLVDLAVIALAFVGTLVVWRRPKAQPKAPQPVAAR